MTAIKKTILFFLFYLTGFTTTLVAQQSNIWYFGEKAGLNFNVSPPQALTDGFTYTLEGTATICDKNGNMLFFTDGVGVYNKNHIEMPNGGGLLGNQSTTEAAIIIPHPGDSNLYYIFTADCYENNFANGYNYSVVDMRLDGGLGNVTSQKNINLYSPSTERLTAVKAANGIDYWVITKGLDNNRFTAYKVDCGGLNPTPVISNVGSTHIYDPTQYVGCGQLKVSPNGKKICVAIAWPVAMAELFDFNSSTGVLSNPVSLTGYTPGYAFIYGIEFSPNSKLLYVTTCFDKTINQYDLSSNIAATINASKITLSTNTMFPVGLQLTPDKRIAVGIPFITKLTLINNPDVYGPGCNLTFNAIDLAGKVCRSGFPAYISSFFDVSNHIDFTSSFIDCHVRFNGTTDLAGSLSWNWDFGDGTFGSGQIVDHSYRQVGTYNVTLKVRTSSNVCSLPLSDSFSTSKPIIINNVFAVDYDHNASCVNQPVQFNDNTVLTVGNITNRSWNFDDGSPTTNTLNPVHTFANPGVYNVKLLISTSGICNADSMIKQIYIDTKPITIFTPIDGCINQPVQFTDNSVNTTGAVSQWKWYFGDGDSSILKNPLHSYFNYGNYNVQLQVTSAHGCAAAPVSKPIVIESKPVAAFDVQFPCLDKVTLFNNSSSNSFGNIISNAWNFGDNNSSALISPTYQYTRAAIYNVSLAISTLNGCITTLIKPIDVAQPYANAGPDTTIISGQPYQMQGAGNSTRTFLWSPPTGLDNAAIARPIARLSQDQKFILTTTSAGGCIATDDVFIKVVTDFDLYVPGAFTPDGNNVNDVLIPYPVGIKELNYFRVYNRYGQLIYSTKQFGTGWDGKIKGVLQPFGNYVWELQFINMLGRTVNKTGTTLLLK